MLLSAAVDVAAGGGEAVAGHGFRHDRDVLRCDVLDGFGDDADGHAGADERAEQHVAAGARGRVDPTDHEPVPGADVGAALRATRAANTPAPKPLSMLTTVTPGAHELSIASSAATPPNEAP